MADVKITDLPVATGVNSSDVVPIVQSGTTKQAAASLLPGSIPITLNNGEVLAQDASNNSLIRLNGNLELGTSTQIILTDINPAGVADQLVLVRNTTGGSPQVGFGQSIGFHLQDSATEDIQAAEINVLWDDPDDSDLKARMEIQETPSNGFTLFGSGAFKFPLLDDPPSPPEEGMMYADTDHHLYYYNGSAWKQLDN